MRSMQIAPTSFWTTNTRNHIVIGPPRFRLWFVGDSANDETVKGARSVPSLQRKVFVSGIMTTRTCAHHGRYECILHASFSSIELLLKFQVQSIFVGTSNWSWHGNTWGHSFHSWSFDTQTTERQQSPWVEVGRLPREPPQNHYIPWHLYVALIGSLFQIL